MKITIAYLSDETAAANKIINEVASRHPTVKVKKSNRHPPFNHAYLTIKKPDTPHQIG